LDGVVIPGLTGNSIQLNNVAEADSGSYNCAATGANISASSDPAELTVSSMYN